jgi:hypothetical protein
MIAFRFPYTTPTQTFTFKNPELNDTDTLVVKTILRLDMSGKPHTFVDGPMNRLITLKFNLFDTDKVDFVNAMHVADDGAAFQYVEDYGGTPTINKVKLTSPDVVISRDSRSIDTVQITLEIVP